MLARTYLLSVSLALLALGLAEDLYFFSHGDTEQRPGLYGGLMEENGTSEDLFSSGCNCAWFEEGQVSFNPMKLRSMAHDPLSNRALLQMTESADNIVSIIKVPLCEDIPTCGNYTKTIEPVFLRNRVAGGTMGPFTMYDSEIYFIFTVESTDGDWTTLTFELRKISGCENSFPVTSVVSFVMSECTQRLGHFLEVSIDKDAESLDTTSTLVAAKTSHGLQFFTLINKITQTNSRADTHSMVLYSLDLEGHASMLHKEAVPINFVGLNTETVGGIAFRDDLLCWTTTTKLLCSHLDDGRLREVTTVLGEGQASQVCREITNEPRTSNVTTGVAIKSISPISVYFGCVSDLSMGDNMGWIPGGGAGLATVHPDSHVTIQPVTSNGTEVFATAMFLTDACADRHEVSGTSQLASSFALIVAALWYCSSY